MFRRMSFVLVLLAGVGMQARGAEAGKEERAKAPRRNFTIGKDTTHILAPLDKQGLIDYAAALNERMSKGVTPRNNAQVLIWRVLGPRADGFNPIAPAYFKKLGMEAPPEGGKYFTGLRAFVNQHPDQLPDELGKLLKGPDRDREEGFARLYKQDVKREEGIEPPWPQLIRMQPEWRVPRP